ncbi:pilus assembly protein PilP [Glaciecola petra]|uniref:Pilus assembly protein PilP n=1 Tax=Glaciecola petra TaxID=3075602 RepID=A0ABU2ZSC0_9ALTE|nr:pilus assembly protein PilP [Aestuariibacter sp. P117]MDT0595529.1 pilus assembly protein PilP [Aestuariibacter sp. P117]
MKKLFITLSCILLIQGCGADIDDLIQYTDQVRSNTQVNIDPYPEFAAMDTVNYQASGLRSPFLRTVNTAASPAAVQTPNCKQPNTARNKQALENFGIDGLQMAGVFTTNGNKYALIKANDGSLHKVTRGSYLGLFNGRVTQITNSEILIQEMLPDGAGCWKSKDTTLNMSSMVGESSNV